MPSAVPPWGSDTSLLLDIPSASSSPSLRPTFGSNVPPNGTLSNVSSNSTQSEDQQRSSSGSTKTIIIAATVSGAVALIFAVAALVYFWIKPTGKPFQQELPSERVLIDNPMASGWADDAWRGEGGRGSPEHPSLAPTGSIPKDVRGDPATRQRSRARREGSAKKRRRDVEEGSIATAVGTVNSTSQWSHTTEWQSLGSTAVDHSQAAADIAQLRSHRHPFAARTPEPDLDTSEEAATQEDSSGSPTEESKSLAHEAETAKAPRPYLEPVSALDARHGTRASALITPTLQNAPVLALAPAPQMPVTRPRPLPMRPVLESQANAARARRQNSDATDAYDESPPSYEAASRPPNRI